MAERLGDTVRFYQLLDCLADRVGGPRLLQSCRAGMGWPPRGVYFFYENGESRSGTGDWTKGSAHRHPWAEERLQEYVVGSALSTSRQCPVRSRQP